jgi:hypothetical protein
LDRSEVGRVTVYGPDIYTEPDGDPDTLANLGPMRPMAGVWEGTKGSDHHPVVEGTEQNTFVEHYELHPIDRQTNGPQLFYGLRYHTHITKPGEVETFSPLLYPTRPKQSKRPRMVTGTANISYLGTGADPGTRA